MDRMVAAGAADAGFGQAARRRGRKVRTPQGSVPDNVRAAGLKAGGLKVPQRRYRYRKVVRVKRCGKSAPRRQ